MKYADCPTVEVSTAIAATPAVVWDLVSDIGLSSRFSTEVSGADWLDGARRAGTRRPVRRAQRSRRHR